MNAYVFVHEATGEILGGLRGLVDSPDNQIRAVASLTGHYDAVVALSANDLSELEGAVFNDIRGAGALKTETVIELPSMRPTPRSPRWNPPEAVEAWVRVRVEPGRAQDVIESLDGVAQVGAATMVAGDFDILAIVGGNTFEEVASALLEVSGISGIAWTASAFTTNAAVSMD